MSRFNPQLWPKPPAIWSYGIAVLSILAAAIISLWPPFHLQGAPASLFLCAILVSAWFGGNRPGLLATALSVIAFYYYFLSPTHSLAAKPQEIPRLAIFVVTAFFVESVGAAPRIGADNAKFADIQIVQAEFRRNSNAPVDGLEGGVPVK